MFFSEMLGFLQGEREENLTEESLGGREGLRKVLARVKLLVKGRNDKKMDGTG